jgi:hypothetical protein
MNCRADARLSQARFSAMSITEGNAELLRLAELLMIGADTARRIAVTRTFDREELLEMVRRACEMAAQLRELCARADEANRRAN